MSSNSFPRTGTMPPVFVSREPNLTPQSVRPGEDYFLIQIYAAQVAFRGQVWDNIKRLVVTSQVNLNHRNLDNRPVRALQRIRDVQKNRSQPLGLTPNLISLVPAVMPNISLSIDFILDRENHLAQLGSLINSDSFMSVLSLAPGASAVAKIVAQLTDKVIQTFIPPQDSKPLLEFSGDFNLATKQLHEGYYIIIGSKDEQSPLPDQSVKFQVGNGGLLVDGQPANQWSYVILDVKLTSVRPRELSDGATWNAKLREAEDDAQRLVSNPLATEEDRKGTWNKCLELIREAQTLLRADDNFLPKDATNIIAATLWNCRKLLNEKQEQTRDANKQPASTWKPPLPSDLEALGLPSSIDLDVTMDKYANELVQSRRILKASGIE